MTQKSEAARAADPRPVRTRAALYDAVLELSADGGDSAPFTVSELVARAGVSRTSFYAHFADLDELMVSLIVDTFREIGTSDIAARHNPSSATPRDLARASLTAAAEHFSDRRRFYRASMGWNLSVKVYEAIVLAYANQVLETLESLPDIPEGVVRTDVATYIGGGQVAVLSAWLRKDPPAPISELVERLLALLPEWLVRDELATG